MSQTPYKNRSAVWVATTKPSSGSKPPCLSPLENAKEEKLLQVRVAPNKMQLCQFCLQSRTEGFLLTLGVFKPPEPLTNLIGSAKPVPIHAVFFFFFPWTYKLLWFPRTIQYKRKRKLANGGVLLNWDGRQNQKKKMKAGMSLWPMYTWDLYWQADLSLLAWVPETTVAGRSAQKWIAPTVWNACSPFSWGELQTW